MNFDTSIAYEWIKRPNAFRLTRCFVYRVHKTGMQFPHRPEEGVLGGRHGDGDRSPELFKLRKEKLSQRVAWSRNAATWAHRGVNNTSSTILQRLPPLEATHNPPVLTLPVCHRVDAACMGRAEEAEDGATWISLPSTPPTGKLFTSGLLSAC